MDGINNLTKKEAMDNVLPKLENYLKDKNNQNKLKNLVNKKPQYEKNLLRKYLYKWYGKSHKIIEIKEIEVPKPEKEEENTEDKIKELRKKIYMKSIVIKKEKNGKNIIREYFYKWYKKVIIIKIKEEIDKSKDKDKELKDKEKELIQEYNKKLLAQKKEAQDEILKYKNLLDKMKKEKVEPKDIKEEEIKDLDKNKNLLDYLKGTEILQRAVWRNTHKDPLDAMGEKVDLENTKNSLRNLLKIKKLSDKDLLRKYFNIWKNNVLKKKSKDALYELLARLILINANNFKKKILAKKFNQWRHKAIPEPEPYVQKEIDSLKKAKDVDDFTNIIKKVMIKNLGPEFMDKLDKYRNPERINNRLRRLYKRKEKEEKDLLKKAFDKWKDIINKKNIKILRSKIL